MVSGRIIRCLLLFQEFNITIIDKLDKANIVDKFLSRMRRNRDDEQMQDYFSNERLFVISIHTPWFTDIANYLET